LGGGGGVITSKTVAKGHPKTRKIANFDNIKGNVNEMKTSFMQNKNRMK
jgi:hypothetical protein